MRAAAICKVFCLTFFSLTSFAYSQDRTQGPPDAAAMKRLRFREAAGPPGGPFAAVLTPPATWTLDTTYRTGTYGIDFSYYETDGCKVDWQALARFGLRYVYLETSTGVKAPPSVLAAWQQLASLHASKTLFRGAYHFLYPNFLVIANSTPKDTDASVQAKTFWQNIGVVPGQKPAQLAPIIDMEPTKTRVDPNSADWADCPQDSREIDNGKNYCDMWYKMEKQDIATFAQDWIGKVEQATSQHVTIYTNANWWQSRLGPSGDALLKNRAIWISRYPQSGRPDYVSSWTGQGGNPTLGMPPLPSMISYPSPYNTADFWQFAASGTLSSDPFTCSNPSDDPKGNLDFSFVPISGTQFETVFGVQ
jgi:Glycosyl hydrolases family 25